MKAETNVSPGNPLGFQLKAAVKSLKPLLKSGALHMKPHHLPTMLKYLVRWRFAVSGLIHMSALRYPDRLALVDEYGELTYRELRDETISLAEAMMDRGLKAHTAFGVMARNGRGIVEPMAVKGLVGAEIMLMNTGASPAQIEGLIKQNDMRFLFIDEEFLGQLPEDMHGCHVIVSHLENRSDRSNIPAGAEVMEDLVAEGGRSTIPFKPEQGRIIIMSSGTTGLPKGILRDEPRTPATLGAVAERIPWRRNMVIHQSATMFHAWGWANVIIAMITGATVVTHRNIDGRRMVDQLEKYGCNGIIGAAVWLRKMRDVLAEDPSRSVGPFEFMVSSGNAIPPWLVMELTERFGPVVCNFYGSTEAGLTSIATGPEMAQRPGTAGRPAIGVRLAIIDDEGNEVPRGEIGRLVTAQELTFNGYLSDKDRFHTYDGMFEIGDLAKMDDDGYIYVCGRSDDMIIKGGENVFPREVEELVGPIDGVGDIFGRGVHDDELMAELHLYVVRSDDHHGRTLTEKGIQDYVADRLASWSVPDKVIFVDHLPRNPAGKVVPRDLDRLVAAGRTS